MALRESKILKELVLTLQPEARLYEVMDTELDGFGVRVNPGGTVAFILRWSLHGRDGGATLGVFPEMTVAAARKKATSWKGMLADGVDPRADRKRIRAAQTMKQMLILSATELFGAGKENRTPT